MKRVASLCIPPVPLPCQYNVLGIVLSCGSLTCSPLYTGRSCVPKGASAQAERTYKTSPEPTAGRNLETLKLRPIPAPPAISVVLVSCPGLLAGTLLPTRDSYGELKGILQDTPTPPPIPPPPLYEKTSVLKVVDQGLCAGFLCMYSVPGTDALLLPWQCEFSCVGQTD